MRYIAFDVESGGTTVNESILTAYFVILEEDFTTVVDELYLHIKPNDNRYIVTAGALNVNHINLQEHDKIAMTENQAATELYKFLEKNNPQGKSKMICVGHNVAFDAEFIKAKLTKNFHNFVSYRCLDSSSVIQFMKLVGAVPRDLGGSLEEIAKHLGIDTTGAHDAKVDTWLAVRVLQELSETY